MDDLIQDFLVETNEGLEKLDNDLVQLEQTPGDQALLGNIFRIMHTIKGTCGFLGLPKLESVAHAGENIMDNIRSGKLTANPNAITIILECLDNVKTIVKNIEDTNSEGDADYTELVKKLNAFANSEETTDKNSDKKNTSEETTQEDDLIQNLENKEETEVEHQQAEQVEEKPKEVSKPVEVKAPIATPSDKANNNSNQSIRVSLDVLENLMQQISELVLTRNQLIQLARNNHDTSFVSPLQRLNLITSELQEGVMKTRMQPISNAWSKFPRLVRDISVDLNKKINLHQFGEETELDRQLLEFIKDPLTHMIRNSCDHGIEIPEDRIKAGKSPEGNINLRAFHQGGHIIIQIEDDGKGLSINRIREKAVSKGILTQQEADNASNKQIQQFIFHAGFSTAEKITAVSGRGVGMDVVKTNIEKISGTIEMDSKEGIGTTFTIKIPLTLAIMSILIFEVRGLKFGLPQINALEMVKLGHSYKVETINNSKVLRLRDNLLPLIYISDILKLNGNDNPNDKEKLDNFIIVCEVGGYHYGIVVDKVFDTEEIVVKPMSPILKNIMVYSGTTILGDGSVIMILDANGILKSVGDININNINKETKQVVDLNPILNFLLFSCGDGSPKVVPLELIARLEEIDVKNIEKSNNQCVIQYRDSLMYLYNMTKHDLPESGIIQVIVFTNRNKILGLVVENIIDIAEDRMHVYNSVQNEGFLGNIIIKNKTCDLIDISYYFSQVFSEDEMNMTTESDNITPQVLLVDDSPFFRKFIPPALTSSGYNVNVADSGKSALTLMENIQFDVIITDINMPNMNGYQLLQIIKNKDIYKHIPVIALSSRSKDETLEAKENHAHDFDEYVLKTNHSDLINAVGIITGKIKKVTANYA